MPSFDVISAAEAPRPQTAATTRLAQRMREYEEFVNSVKPGTVGRLTPDEGETARGLVLRINRAAGRIHKKTSTWIADNAVYFTIEGQPDAVVAPKTRRKKAASE